MKFFLESEIDNSRYEIEISLTLEEMENYYDCDKFQSFMEKMETEPHPWCGVHDAAGGLDEWGYSSYEIQDFKTAIKMWEHYFKNEGLLVE